MLNVYEGTGVIGVVVFGVAGRVSLLRWLVAGGARTFVHAPRREGESASRERSS